VKILHCSYSAYPDPPGGTEIYVAALCRSLDKRGVDNVVVAPGSSDGSLEWNGLRIRKYAVSPTHELVQLYGASDAETSARFARILDEERPDVVHQHALTSACSSEVARHAKARGLPVVFTYHTPTVTCQRGTLMEWGTTQCDGRLDLARCTACSLHGLGAGASASRVLARMPDAGGRLLGSLGLAGGAWTALRMSSLLTIRHQEVAAFFELIDKFVVLTPWVGELLRANGVAEDKLTMSTHGIEGATNQQAKRRGTAATLRIAHLGRMDPTKGTALFIEALRAVPGPDISLDVYGVVQHAGARELMEDVRRAALEDRRIRFHPSIPHEGVIPTLARYDLVAIPSQWMETGPLVALEAFAAGVPVLGSALGGLADKIQDGTNGLLVRPHDSVDAWRDVLDRCCRDRDLVAHLARGVSRPKSMSDVAIEMLDVYAALAPNRPVKSRLAAPHLN
jgi:glycosyltransferase involved in cell wall biosynthesis